ncbi:MAG: hypothetical protein Kow0090_21750 [Myxococcota bacterium]
MKYSAFPLLAIILIPLALFASGCAGGGESLRREEGEKEFITISEKRVSAPPLVVLAGKDRELGLEAYDDAVLLSKGEEALKAGDFAFAIKFFARLLLEFPDSTLSLPARYNLGYALARAGECEKAVVHLKKFIEAAETAGDDSLLVKAMVTQGFCLAKIGLYEEAISLYEKVSRRSANAPEAIDALFYRGDALFHLKRYDEAIKQYEELLDKFHLFPHAVIETITRIAQCYIAKGELEKAESVVWGAMTYYKRMENEEYIEPRYIAEAQYQLGEIYRIKFQNVVLEFPQEVMAERLEEKAQHLLKAQMYYLKTIRRGDVQWAAASGYRVGELYEEMYDAVMKAPIPNELTKEEGEYYHNLLRKRVKVLVKKAIQAYESTLNMAFRVGFTGEWVQLTNERMNRMKEIYINEPDIEEPPPETKEIEHDKEEKNSDGKS